MISAITKNLRFMGFRLLRIQKLFSVVVFICFYKARFFKIGTIPDTQPTLKYLWAG